MIYAIMFSIIICQGLIMFNKLSPFTQTLETPIDHRKENEVKYYLKDLNRILFQVLNNKFDRFTQKEIEPYIEIRLKFVRKYFKDGE